MTRMFSYPLLAGIVTLCVPMILAVMAPGIAHAANFYCCKNDDQRQVCGDFVPTVCRDRSYRIVNEAGVTINIIAAPLTSEQKAAIAAAEKRRKEEFDAKRIQDMKDRALLDSFPSLKDLDDALLRNEEEAQRIINVSENAILTLKTQKQTLLDEAKLRGAAMIPSDVEARINNFNRQVLEQEALIEQQQKNIASLRIKFAEDRRRYLELRPETK